MFTFVTLTHPRATPIKKVSTLPTPTLRLLAHVRNKLDYWGCAAQPLPSPPAVLNPTPHLLPPQPLPYPPHAQPPPPTSLPGISDAGQGPQPPGAGAGALGAHSFGWEQPGAWQAGEGEEGGVVGWGQECDLVVRGAHNGWVVALVREGPRRMLVGLDPPPVAPTLPAVTGHTLKLCDQLYPGLY